MVDAVAIKRAVARSGLLQLLDEQEVLKLDVYARELIPGELDRSESAEVFDGMVLPICSLADSAASKLVWVSKGSHKGRRDVRLIFANASDEQQTLIRHLADQLKLAGLLNELLAESVDELE